MHHIKKVALRASTPLEPGVIKGELALRGTFLFGAHGPKSYWNYEFWN